MNLGNLPNIFTTAQQSLPDVLGLSRGMYNIGLLKQQQQLLQRQQAQEDVDRNVHQKMDMFNTLQKIGANDEALWNYAEKDLFPAFGGTNPLKGITPPHERLKELNKMLGGAFAEYLITKDRNKLEQTLSATGMMFHDVRGVSEAIAGQRADVGRQEQVAFEADQKVTLKGGGTMRLSDFNRLPKNVQEDYLEALPVEAAPLTESQVRGQFLQELVRTGVMTIEKALAISQSPDKDAAYNIWIQNQPQAVQDKVYGIRAGLVSEIGKPPTTHYTITKTGDKNLAFSTLEKAQVEAYGLQKEGYQSVTITQTKDGYVVTAKTRKGQLRNPTIRTDKTVPSVPVKTSLSRKPLASIFEK